jgi:hypothetical protein
VENTTMIKWFAVPALALALSLASTTARALPCAGFTDVDDTSQFCGNVTWLKNRGITLGCTSTTLYCPNDFVSRLQMAAFMNRLGDSLFPLTCAAGQVMKWDGLQWACANDALGGGAGGGTVTSVAAGTGLQGSPNPITGAGSINLAPAYQLPQACSNGQVPKSNGAGGWVCGTDTAGAGTVTSLSQGTGITLSANPITTTGSIAADTTYLQRRVSATCAVGSSIRAIAADGSVSCQADSSGPANAFVQGGNSFGATATLGTNDAQAVEIRAASARVFRYEPDAISPNIIGGHPTNNVTASVRGATIAGGGAATGDSDPDFAFEGPNRVTDAYGTVGGGYANRAGDDANTTADRPFATVGGGLQNTASGQRSTVGGGWQNTATGINSIVGGGAINQASGVTSTVGGGASNQATGNYSTIGGGWASQASGVLSNVSGGFGNFASGESSTVPGGAYNLAQGIRSLAAGHRAKSISDGCFTWADNSDFDFSCAFTNAFTARATGGVYFVTAINGSGAPVAGVQVAGGGGSWSSLSDRAAKRDLAPADADAVLSKVVALPIYTWRYKTETSGALHLGPVSQDFRAAFGLGDSDQRITTVDADGVALAAIQGLNAKVVALQEDLRARDDDSARQRAELLSVRAELAAMRATHDDVAVMKAALQELLRERAGGVTRARLAPAKP